MHDYSSQTFAVQVAADDWGIFTQGTILIIDPSVTPCHRDYVVVFKEGQSKASIKLFLCGDENKYLQSICIAEDVVSLTSSYKILGVVMEYWKQLKKTNKVCKLNGSIIEKKQMVSI